MKTIRFSALIFYFIIALGIFTTPTNDLLEITALLSQLSEPKERCYCAKEMEEGVLFLEKYCLGKN